MTLVAALKSGSRIVVMSDTMITNRDSRAANVLPGQLKALVVNKWLTIAYAGLSTQALDAIRNIRNKPGINTDNTIAELLSESIRHDGEIDFLVCSHENIDAPRMAKVTANGVFEGAASYWLGTLEAANSLSKMENRYGPHPQDIDYVTPGESEFTAQFFEFMRETKEPSIGGVPICCLCSSYGHCYQNHTQVTRWDTITIPNFEDPLEITARLQSGLISFEFHVYSANERGLCVVGLYLDQPRIGYIYDPFRYEQPIFVRANDQGHFHGMIHGYEVAHLGREPIMVI